MKAREILLEVIKEEGGATSNQRAMKILKERLHIDLSKDEYNEIKTQLIDLGLAAKGNGRGGSIRIIKKTNKQEENEARVLNQLLMSIRRTPGAFAKLNRSSITCLLSSSKDKLYAGFDTEEMKYHLTYRVEKSKPDHTKTVLGVFKKACHDMQNVSITTGCHYTRAVLSDSLAQFNLFLRRLCDLLEDENLQNTLDDNRYWTREFGGDKDESYFTDIAKIISFAATNDLKWPFGSAFRNALGFDTVDHLVTIGQSFEAIRSNRNTHYREHVVPVKRVKEMAYEMARNHASTRQITEFLKHHLLIVIITKEEAELLDRQLTNGGLSLRTNMPENWSWGDDPMERLSAAGIKIEMFKDYTPKIWKAWRPQKRNYIKYILNKNVITF